MPGKILGEALSSTKCLWAGAWHNC